MNTPNRIQTPRTKAAADRVNQTLARAKEKGDNDGFSTAVKDSMVALLKNGEQLEVDLVILMGAVQKLLRIQTPPQAQSAMLDLNSIVNSINSRGQNPSNPK